ncbi:MAG: YaaR family protein [Spirochaetes bacterium]|nr:YaaR family protein [Spirochaetota bacterium]
MFNLKKLSNLTSKSSRTGSKKNKKRIKSGKNQEISLQESSFSETLSKVENEVNFDNIEQYLQAIEKQGEKMQERPNRQEFLRYKSLIKRFLKRIMMDSVKVRKQKVYKKDREYVIVDIIDEKLYRLGQYILLEESEHIILASKIDEIRGLLYDSVRDIEGRNSK